MKAQSHGEHAGSYPDTDVRERIDVSRQWIWFGLIDRRCRTNGQATQDEARRIGTFSKWLQRTSR